MNDISTHYSGLLHFPHLARLLRNWMLLLQNQVLRARALKQGVSKLWNWRSGLKHLHAHYKFWHSDLCQYCFCSLSKFNQIGAVEQLLFFSSPSASGWWFIELGHWLNGRMWQHTTGPLSCVSGLVSGRTSFYNADDAYLRRSGWRYLSRALFEWSLYKGFAFANLFYDAWEELWPSASRTLSNSTLYDAFLHLQPVLGNLGLSSSF